MNFHVYLMAVVCSLAPTCLFAQSVPLDHEEILGRLAVGYAPSYVAHLVKIRAVDFPVSADFLDRVKAAGGSGILLERLSSADAPSAMLATDPKQGPTDHLAKCAELVHIGETELAKVECHAAVDENPKSPWPLLVSAELLQAPSPGVPRGAYDPAMEEASRAKQQQLLRQAESLTPELPMVKNPKSFGLYLSAVPAVHDDAADPNQFIEESEDDGIYERGGYAADPQTPDQLDESEHDPVNSLMPEINTALEVSSHPEQTGSKGPIPSDADRHRMQMEPDLASTHAHLACEYAMSHKLEGAESELREAIRLEPDNAELHTFLGVFYLSQHKTEVGLAELREAVRIVSSGDRQYVDLADKLEDLGRTSQAIKVLQRIVSVHPADDYPSDKLVQLYRKHKDSKAAVEAQRNYLKAASAYYPDQSKFVDTHFIDLEHLAWFTLESGDLDGASEQYVALLRSKPENAALHVDYGNVLMNQRRFDEATGQFNEALRLDPTMSSAHVDLGRCLGLKNDLDGAIDHYHQAIEIEREAKNPEEIKTRILLGSVLVGKGDLNGAIDQFQQAVRMDPQDGQAHVDLGYTLLMLKDTFSAMTEAKRAEELEPNSPIVENILAQIYITSDEPKLRNPAKALILARRAVDSSPPNPYFLDTLAQALLLNGRAGEALAAETEAAKLDPDNVTLRSRIESFRKAAELAKAPKR